MSKSGSDTSSLAKSWELNQYELNRIPHEIINEDIEIAISPQTLRNELLCPICLEILKRTMTTKECLHRFCHDCIITALRSGNKECPTCRKKLASKRSLRPDPNFDAIITKIFPNREEYETMHERVLEKLKYKKILNNQHTKSISRRQSNQHKPETTTKTPNDTNQISEEADNEMDTNTNSTTTQSNSSKKLTSKQQRALASSTTNNNNNNNSDAESDSESRTSTEQSSSMHTENIQDEVEIILKPHPLRESNLNLNRFIKTTPIATVSHLSKYLSTRLNVESGTYHTPSPSSSSSVSNGNPGTSGTTYNTDNSVDFQIFFSSNDKKSNCFHNLQHEMTIEQVVDKHWKQNRPLELFYLNQKSMTTSLENSKNNNYAESHSNGVI